MYIVLLTHWQTGKLQTASASPFSSSTFFVYLNIYYVLYKKKMQTAQIFVLQYDMMVAIRSFNTILMRCIGDIVYYIQVKRRALNTSWEPVVFDDSKQLAFFFLSSFTEYAVNIEQNPLRFII